MSVNIPLWGHEDKLEAIVGVLEGADHSYFVDVVSEPGAPVARFLTIMIERLIPLEIKVLRVRANDESAIRPGKLADEIERDWPSSELIVIVVEDAHLADRLSLGRLTQRCLNGSTTHLIVARQDLSGTDLRPFENLKAIGSRLGTYHRIDLSPPTIGNLAEDLDLNHESAAALYGATAGHDDLLVELLAELEEAVRDSEVQDPEGFLTRLTVDAAPLRELDELERRIVELVTVAISPLSGIVLAPATGGSERDVLDAVERLVAAGLVTDTAAGVHRADNARSGAIGRSLSSSRSITANRNLATALTESGSRGIEPAIYFERAGAWTDAFDGFLATASAASAGNDPLTEAVATDRALACLDAGATTDSGTRGRLLLARARALRFGGDSTRALDDLREAVTLLQGTDRIDALGYLAAVLDDQQLPQDADVAVAVAEWEAHHQGAREKLGSLLSLRARTASRLGFAPEADHALTLAVDLTAAFGSTRQQRNVRNNRAWMAFDRGEVATAEQLFAELADASDDLATEVDARAWQARSLALRGWAGDAEEALAFVRSHSNDPGTMGAQFLAAIGAHELAMRTGRFADALAATNTELGYVTLFLPAWENGTRYRQADALRALGRLEEAGVALTQSLELSPPGANGTRWRLRAQVLQTRIDGESDGRWDQKAAEDLTDVLLHAGWLGAAAELMVARANAQNDAGIAADASALAMRLGDPITAAAAVEAAGLWSEEVAVARAVRGLKTRIPDEMQTAWRALPGIEAALDQPPVEELSEPDWHADLRTWLDEAGLGEDRISPAQRRDRQLVRRTAAPRRWGTALLAASVAASVVLITMVGLFASGFFDPEPEQASAAPTTLPPTTTTVAATTSTTVPLMEETAIDAPNTLAGTFLFRGGNTRSGLVDSDGIAEPTGYYYLDDTPNPVRSSPTVRGTKAFVGGEDGDIHIVDFVRNIELTVSMSDDIVAPVIVAEVRLGGLQSSNTEALIYAADRRGRVVALKQDTSEFGRLELDTDITAAPTVTDDGVIILTADGRILAFSHDLSELLWEYPGPDDPPVNSRFAFTPAAIDGLLYAASNDGVVYAIDQATGTLKCTYDARIRISAGPSIAEGRVWIPAGTAIHVLEAGTCAPPLTGQIQVQIVAPAVTSPVVLGSTMFVSSNRLMISLDLTATGSETGENWSVATGGLVRSSPIYANGTLYFGSDDGSVYAVDAESGTVLWTFDTGGPVQASVAVIDGAIVATNNDGRIVVIAGAP